MYCLGVNLGITSISVGIVNSNGDIILIGSVPTLRYRNIDNIVKDMADLCIKVTTSANLDIKKDIGSIGIASACIVDKENGVLVYSSYFGFKNVPIREIFNKYIDIPVYVENDANCYAFAESLLGAAKNYKNSVTLKIGNTIGAGIIIDGKIYNGGCSGAGEVGHQVMVFQGEQCNCGRRGCWEAYASATALVRDARIQAIRHPESEMFKMVNGDLRVMNYEIPFEAAKTGDKWAKEIIGLYIRYLSVGIINIVNMLQPDVLVIGGRMSLQGDYLIDPVREIVESRVYGYETGRTSKIVKAKYNIDGIIMGAALIRE